MKNKESSNRAKRAVIPAYSIRKHIAFWSLTFNGQRACFDHEQGAYYVAYLLLNPPDEPIHGMVLELKAKAYFHRAPGVACNTYITDPLTGQTLTLGCYAAVEWSGTSASAEPISSATITASPTSGTAPHFMNVAARNAFLIFGRSALSGRIGRMLCRTLGLTGVAPLTSEQQTERHRRVQ